MLTILIFVLVLGVLVFVHELGHFMVARMNGIKADEFGFGFPPRLAGIVKDDATGRYRLVWGNVSVSSPHTVYSINWIPLGGFVKIKGEDRGVTWKNAIASQAGGLGLGSKYWVPAWS